MTTTEAIEYLRGEGLTIEPAPRKFQARGFSYYCPEAMQMLSDSDIVEFAESTQEFKR